MNVEEMIWPWIEECRQARTPLFSAVRTHPAVLPWRFRNGYVTVTVAVAEPPLLLVAVPTYVPGRFGTWMLVLTGYVWPGCSGKLLV